LPDQSPAASGSGADPPLASAVTVAAIPGAQPAPTLAQHEAEKRRLASQREKNLLAYGKVYAYGALIAMGIQILIADVAFYWYGYEHVVHRHHWQIPTGAIQVWIGATVVQVIGIVLVIARSLFPSDAGPAPH
jgi:hypothetical protein